MREKKLEEVTSVPIRVGKPDISIHNATIFSNYRMPPEYYKITEQYLKFVKKL